MSDRVRPKEDGGSNAEPEAPSRAPEAASREVSQAPSVTLAALREQVDSIDKQVVSLLNQRAALAIEIGRAKAALKKPLYAPHREQQLLERLQHQNPGPLPSQSLRSIYREIMSASLALESPLRVAYLGPEATFTHQAATRQFGSSALLQPERSIAEVFEKVERGSVDYGVVPVENSTEGVVTRTLDRLMNSELVICGEVVVDVHHCLLTRSGHRGGIDKVYSHPHAFAQCRQWLATNMPDVALEDVDSTARAAQLAANLPNAAAIASELAAQVYGLDVAAARIEDARSNVTRFLLLGHNAPEPTGQDRTSIMFALKDAPGILFHALEPFAKRHINLSRIESRPSRRRSWDYLFFIDLEGHRDNQPVRAAIEALGEVCQFIKVLGSYPRQQQSVAPLATTPPGDDAQQ